MAKEDTFTIEQVARAVFSCDEYTGDLNAEQLAHIVELTLKSRIGQNCFLRGSIAIDLGNGRQLRCTLEPR